MNDLPIGWANSSLSEVLVKLVDGSHNPPQKQSSGLPMLSARNIEDGEILFNDFRLIKEEDFEIENRRTDITPNDILLTIVGAIGRSAVVPIHSKKFSLQRSVAVLRPANGINSKYLKYLFDAPEFQKWMADNAKGTAQKGVYLKTLGSASIDVAPLGEQGRIVEKLDELLGRSRRAREELQHIPKLIQRYKQAVLAAACSGRITADWRINNDINFSKLSEALLDLRTGPFGSVLHKSDYVTNGLPVINPMHINDGKITPSSDMTISLKKSSTMQDFLMQTGDVVMARRGVVGRCAVVEKNHNGWLCGTGSMILRPNKDLLVSSYLQIFLSSPQTIQVLSADAVGSTMINLNQRGILSLEMFLPSVEEQKEIVRRVEERLKAIEAIEQNYQNAIQLLDRLDQATLAKAFRGQLVPQDPNDEPASVLLERIRAQRASQPPARKRKAKTTG